MARPKRFKKSGNKNRSGRSEGSANREHWLFGVHAVLSAMQNPKRIIQRIIITDEAASHHEDTINMVLEYSELDLPGMERMSRDDISALLPEGVVHQGIAALVSPLEETYLEDVVSEIELEDRARNKAGDDGEGRTVVLVLDQVTDPHNVGAILRSAAAFNARAVITTDRKAAPPTGTLAKTASGALEVVPYVGVPNLVRGIEQLKRAGFWVYGLAGEGEKNLSDALPAHGKIALIMGAEGSGLRRLTREHCDMLVKLPTSEVFSVLNVSAAAAVALYETARGADT
ncbi:23S rRNA (guanosine(2251)-2'-O)-methyltransferase RlmB [Kiloniella sp. b19]|uniref:23S rRNA (guanosine(2251)-2'-O)-methyltransferase RlmB n=1 Tax=Kiloniella sp. GXU_MW_B19 TaxID=3141326 RepID=UPI0031D669E7